MIVVKKTSGVKAAYFSNSFKRRGDKSISGRFPISLPPQILRHLYTAGIDTKFNGIIKFENDYRIDLNAAA